MLSLDVMIFLNFPSLSISFTYFFLSFYLQQHKQQAVFPLKKKHKENLPEPPSPPPPVASVNNQTAVSQTRPSPSRDLVLREPCHRGRG